MLPACCIAKCQSRQYKLALLCSVLTPLTVEVLQSTRPVLNKLLWALLAFIFPIGGVIIYFIFANRNAHRPGAGYQAIP